MFLNFDFMIEDPKTPEEKMQYIRERAPYVVSKSGVIIYGQVIFHENYFLCSDGMVSAKSWGGGRVRKKISIEVFYEKCGEQGLDYAIKQLKLRIKIPENSS